MLIDIIGPHVCVGTKILNPRDRLVDKAFIWMERIYQVKYHDYDGEDEEDGRSPNIARTHPEARKKKAETDKKINARPDKKPRDGSWVVRITRLLLKGKAYRKVGRTHAYTRLRG